MYIRRPPSDTNGDVMNRSLAFLHKPQRVSQPKPFAEESLRRNTDLNRGKVQVNEMHDDYFSSQTPASADGSVAGDVSSQLRVNPYFPANENYYYNSSGDGDDADNEPPPLVRKKSGEVVRSNLKLAQRSRSLPATPSGREPDKRIGAPPPGPQRSKSVHFDQRDVVKFKYFWQEDSPLDVASQDVLEGPLDEDPHTLTLQADAAVRSDGSDAEPRDLTMTMSNLQIEKRMSSGLRRSKRYQRLRSKGAEKDGATKPGLYRENFATLSDDDQSSLKSNIFLNIAHNSYCFLQDLSLIADQHYLVGHVLVKNIFYDKEVVVRYTRDHWRTVHEVECVWESSGDDVLPGMGMDRFKLVIDLATLGDDGGAAPRAPRAGPAAAFALVKLEFCIRYTTRSSHERVEHWDNNGGRNYVVDVVCAAQRMGFTDPFGPPH
ncbi:CBM21 domain-containing protein [Lachancea thermotolerans CBS 6340]|uniref:KLTH0A04092p n=1 Tax=Lachancea thermotolerans (strain ATCC 56472 / CBS 6340 / NRRL Y-8284) TaxID=559295 RepID=C5DBN5_LACTC|nr:KLTH0A04092p [Lachancea thermotolerans CBS 6340]CAR21192.1 KLTH0A04092p [Lachancea thermotolerans CBS 6340]